MREEKKENIFQLSRTVAIICLIIYLSVLFWQTFFFAYGSYQRSPQTIIGFNLVPCKTILHYVLNFRSFNGNVWFFNLFGNVMAFMPLGFLLPFTREKLNKLEKIIIVAVFLSLFIEVMQMLYGVGVFDIDDILLNTLGGVGGYLIKQLICNSLRKYGAV